MDPSFRIDIVAAVNNDNILKNNLSDSKLCRDNQKLFKAYGCSSTGEAYNKGLDSTTADIVVFTHQDVYFPDSWLMQLKNSILTLENIDPNWAILGVYGITSQSRHVGYCWSTGLGKILGTPLIAPVAVVSIDELVIVMRRCSGLRFDEQLPGFHLYGTDIVQLCLAHSYGAYVIHAPVIHNSKPVKSLSGSYTRAYWYMQKKWNDILPLPTTVVAITPYGIPLFKYHVRRIIKSVLFKNNNNNDIIEETGAEICRRIYFKSAATRETEPGIRTTG